MKRPCIFTGSLLFYKKFFKKYWFENNKSTDNLYRNVQRKKKVIL